MGNMLRPLKGPDSLFRSWGGYRSDWEPSLLAWISPHPGLEHHLTCSFLFVGVEASSSLRRILSPHLSLLILCDLIVFQSLGTYVRPFLFVRCPVAESCTLETSLSILRTCVQSCFSRDGAGPASPILLQPQLEVCKEHCPYRSGDLGPNTVSAINWQSSWQDTYHF